MQTQVPYAVQEAIVQACGTVFWYKRPLRALLVRSGIPGPLIEKYEDASKFIMVREILAELDARGQHGARVQHQLVRELAAMRTVADPDNRAAGLRALADLREVAEQQGIIERERPQHSQRRQHNADFEERHNRLAARAKGLAELRSTYARLVSQEGNPQQRGYEFERLIGGLFKLHDIPYGPPFRKGKVEQTDGFFKFEGFRYVIEDRWRTKPPTIGELREFSGKVKAKIESTRGLFVSVVGFREEVLSEAATLLNLVLMDGQDLALILEDRVSLREALRLKLDRAAQQGVLFYPLVACF